MNSDHDIEIEIPNLDDDLPAIRYANSVTSNLPDADSPDQKQKLQEDLEIRVDKKYENNVQQIEPEDNNDFFLSKSFSESIKFAFDSISTTFNRSKSTSEHVSNDNDGDERKSVDKKHLLLKLAEKKIQELGIPVSDKIIGQLNEATKKPIGVKNLHENYEIAVNTIVENHFTRKKQQAELTNSLIISPHKIKADISGTEDTPVLRKTASSPYKFHVILDAEQRFDPEHTGRAGRALDLSLSPSQPAEQVLSNDPSFLNARIIEEQNKLSTHAIPAADFDPSDLVVDFEANLFAKQIDPNEKIVVITDNFIKKEEQFRIIRTREEQIPKYSACLICFQLITPQITCEKLPCEHQLCKLCVVEYLKEAIKANKVRKITCPTGECKESWNDQLIKRLISEEEFTRYEKLKRIGEINSDPSLRWCIKPGCDRYNKGSTEKPYIRCECGTEICFNCSLAWHPKKTCEKAIESEYKNYATSKEVQFCPFCKSRCEKDSGCNHMTCAICTYQWCWLCRRKYTPGHYSPLNILGCPGLQGGNNERKKWNCGRILALRGGLLLIWILLIIMSPFILLVATILFPWWMYYEKARLNRNWRRQSCGNKCFAFTFFFIIGIILLPVFLGAGMILLIIPGTCFFAVSIIERVKKCRKSRRMRQKIRRRPQTPALERQSSPPIGRHQIPTIQRPRIPTIQRPRMPTILRPRMPTLQRQLTI